MANTPKVQRPRRTSINGVRNVLSVTGTEPGFVYRFVNDTGDRVAQFQEAGYEIVTDEKGAVKVGDKRVGKASATGSAVEANVGQGTKAYLMRIPEEWYQEDQAAKQAAIDQREQAMLDEARRSGLTGNVKISRD